MREGGGERRRGGRERENERGLTSGRDDRLVDRFDRDNGPGSRVDPSNDLIRTVLIHVPAIIRFARHKEIQIPAS